VFLVSKTFRVTSGQCEEANIYYVAVTRAKQELIFVSEDKPRDN
jgi:ATP-dependent exoDNAse (exonuclease V) beta subunit